MCQINLLEIHSGLLKIINSFFANGSNVYLNYVHADDVAKCIFDSAVNGIFLNTFAIISSDISLSDFYHMVISEGGVKWCRYYILGFIVSHLF